MSCAFGGLNKIEFGGSSEFYVNPIPLSTEKISLLQKHLMLFFTGFTRNASDIADEQISKTYSKNVELKTMAGMVDEGINILNDNISSINDFGKLLHEAWQIKKGLANSITTDRIDEIYRAAQEGGAIGGKLLGAGGGGFMLFFAAPDVQQTVKERLRKLLYVPFAFDNLGTQIIVYSTQDF